MAGCWMPLPPLDSAVPGGAGQARYVADRQQDHSGNVSSAFKQCLCDVGVLIKQQADMAASQPGALTGIAQSENLCGFKGFRFNSDVVPPCFWYHCHQADFVAVFKHGYLNISGQKKTNQSIITNEGNVFQRGLGVFLSIFPQTAFSRCVLWTDIQPRSSTGKPSKPNKETILKQHCWRNFK